MCCGQAVGDLRGHLKELAERQRTLLQRFAQTDALDQLHGDERRALKFVDLENRDDVGMIQCRCGARFSLEATQMLTAVDQFFAKNLDRHFAA